MNTNLQTQWQRLILPPDGVPILAGEQLCEGNRYPNVTGPLDWAAHQAGRKTYAVNLTYPGPDGTPWCRAALLDIDEGPVGSLDKARALLAVAKAGGLSCLAAWSGRKGCHVWLFFDPVPFVLARAVLAKLRAAVPFDGEAIPGDAGRVKLPPGRHQVVQKWAFWLDPLPSTPPDLENAPTGFLGAQEAILAGVTPTPRAGLERYAGMVPVSNNAPMGDMDPDLGKLGGNLAPCMAALLDHGAHPALGTWDKNALTLARYAKAAGIEPDTARAQLQRLSDNTAQDFDTTKAPAARLQHWESIHNPGPFGCGFILTTRRGLGFDCGQCAARPVGVLFGRDKAVPGTVDSTAPLWLEPVLADELLALALQDGQPPERINPEIFPPVALPGNDPNTGKPILAPLHALAWRAMEMGHTTPADMLNWLDREDEPPGPLVKSELAALVQRLWGLPLPSEIEQAALLARAVDLSARLVLLAALGVGTQGTKDRRPLVDVLGTLTQTATRLQQAAGTAWGAPLTAYATELLENLVMTERPAIETPFDTLNTLLGGGLHGGKLYVLAAPPGGGKTTLATQIADYAAETGIPTCYCALEMGRGQLFDYALARRIGMNSAKIEARTFRHSDHERTRIATAAQEYLETIAPFLTVIEGGWDTTAAAIGAWVAQARARYDLTLADPVLVCVDYMQLLNTGNEKLDNGGQDNEVGRISTVAVQLKQLSRDSNAAVLALSDITKQQQGDAIKGQEFNLNMLRGSNRIAHAADTVLALYSEAAKMDGGKAENDPWEMLAAKVQGNLKAAQFKRALDDLTYRHPTGGTASVVHSRLELLKNRGGRGRGSQVLIYERAYHRFIGLSVAGQDETEGRG